ncbi:hypothetical protein EIN_423160 [Entamoeba invadens IP1]|uniref:Uncharacterized protein n=1 Tax=Entamoeba invadens IP1 TaxID=370355 RepID=A0A0A1UFY8_ENTIV|nr:hypothetical protein EIN_423160 [Entamoeba invadens IP1]ELP94285.1 hypothetical protein EIN_423160 [Entamoeba invadens IP1]|eukprot:XP_004261056.1 hypothetical protein EIN_423160 [Entamoeba invadens IP1]
MKILELKDQDGAIDAAKSEELSVCMVTKRVVEIIQSFKIACVNNNTSAFHMCGYVKKPIEKEKDGTYDVRIFYCGEYAFRIREFLGEQVCVVFVAFPERRSNLNIDKNEGILK